MRACWLFLLTLGLGVAAADLASAAAPTGEVRVLLMVVDGAQPVPRTLRHAENGTVTTVTWSDVATLDHFAFERDTSYARLYEEMSYGQTRLVGDTLGMAFPEAAGDLTWQQWTAKADAEALALGFDPAGYDRLLYVLPHRPKGVSVAGLSQGIRGWCAYLSAIDLGCLFHELGHTVGLVHAAELNPDGTNNGLGDDSDGLMGSGFNAHVNAVNKLLAGWLTGSRFATFDQSTSASFGLAPLASSLDSLQVLKVVNHGARPVTGVVDTFVSYRDTSGFDAQLLSSLPDQNGDAVADAVLVQQWKRSYGSETLHVRALEAGEVYDEHGVRVEVLGIAAGQADVRVTRAPYAPEAPTVALQPADASSAPGEYRYVTLSITNENDPAGQTFDSSYAVTLPAFGPGWVVGWSSGGAKTVAPGATAQFDFVLIPPANAAGGRFPYSVTVTDADGDAGPVSTTTSGTYSVEGPEPDTDADGIPDSADNCIEEPNADQADVDLDGFGTICDADWNNDGLVGGMDYAILTANFGKATAAYDLTGDGVLGGPDYAIFSRLYGMPPGPSGLACAGIVPCP